jgi:hypothetical protein
MRLLLRLLWVLALPVFPIGACTQVTTAPDTAPVTITVLEWPGLAKRLEGVELCETDHETSCVLTDVNGEATLWLPFDVETSFTRTKKGYASYLVPAFIPMGGTAYSLVMAKEERIATQHDNVGSPYPMRDTGMIALATFPNRSGATIELFGATGTIFYTDEDLNWRRDLPATTPQGAGGVTEVSPGEEYRLEFGGTGEGCIPTRGWSSPFDNSVRFPVREGFLTDLRVACP